MGLALERWTKCKITKIVRKTSWGEVVAQSEQYSPTDPLVVVSNPVAATLWAKRFHQWLPRCGLKDFTNVYNLWYTWIVSWLIFQHGSYPGTVVSSHICQANGKRTRILDKARIKCLRVCWEMEIKCHSSLHWIRMVTGVATTFLPLDDLFW